MSDNKQVEAVDLTKDPLALAMMAAWVGVRVDQLPKEMQAHTCRHTMAAWKRVGDAAVAHLAALNTRPDIEAWKHVKRGTVYEVIGRAELQMSHDLLVDGSEMIVYRGDDGKLWCREEGEFMDGRFIPVPTSGEGNPS